MLPKVDEFYAGNQDLSAMFDVATKDIMGTGSGYFFSHIWMPLKMSTEDGTPINSTYVDIGLSLDDLADCYWSEFSSFYFNCKYYHLHDDETQERDIQMLWKRARSVLLKNKYKYLKMIELMGLDYNPLFNVDGIEIRQHLANEGVNDENVTSNDKSGTKTNDASFQEDNKKNQHNVAPYDSATTKEEYNDVEQGQDTLQIVEGGVSFDESGASWTDGSGTTLDKLSHTDHRLTNQFTDNTRSETREYVHNNAKNMTGSYTIASGDSGVKIFQVSEEDGEVQYYVDPQDTAFGYRLIGGDKMEIEKLIRQGNIGVTKTTELIDAQRELVRFSIIDEYFKDLNKVILVGVY